MKVYKIPKRFDTTTADKIQENILEIFKEENPSELVLDFSESEYVSSAGLRVVVLIAKKMKVEKRELILRNMPEAIYNIFKNGGIPFVFEYPE